MFRYRGSDCFVARLLAMTDYRNIFMSNDIIGLNAFRRLASYCNLGPVKMANFFAFTPWLTWAASVFCYLRAIFLSVLNGELSNTVKCRKVM